MVTDTLYATTNEVSQVDIPSFWGTLRRKGLIKRANSGLYQPPFQLYLCFIMNLLLLSSPHHSGLILPVSFLTAAGLPQPGVSHHGLCWYSVQEKSMQSHHNWTCSTSNLIHATTYAYKIDSDIYIYIVITKGWAAASFQPSLWQQHVFSPLQMPLSVT